ncbi:spindle pole body formation-associated protein-domain-containing protein [Aspergillus unguis]
MMFGWASGRNDHAPDDSKVMEPPETPAPVFALRAFQSALFGTPKADDEDNTTTLKSKEQLQSNQRSKDNTSQKPGEQKADTHKPSAADVDLAANAMASPTKSILMTPGTVSNRRKTVSFGDGVVDNERKRDGISDQPTKTTPATLGNISSQWISSSSEGKRSRLTQALMDSREKSSKSSEKSSKKPDESRSVQSSTKPDMAPAQDDDNEDTINMNEPRSRSGQYWKAEFDSYRSKTALEIRRLIQYRSAAKTYAKKKDEEAYRLAAKLKDEELRVEEMERHVTHLASTMVTENTRADKEQLVQDLTKQTALALQYKHKVSLLRKTLEQHGVVGSEVNDIAMQPDTISNPKEASDALQQAQQALAQANSEISEMKQQQSDFDKLKGLAFSSEQKASELEKENTMLKHTLARFKQEASKYEGRRKEREARLKQRENKLEVRIQEYRDRLKSTSQQHREQEEDLKASFNEERRRMKEQIDGLKTKLRALENATQAKAQPRPDSRMDNHRVQLYELDVSSPQKEAFDETDETGQPPSPSPRGKMHVSGLQSDLADTDLRRAMEEMGIVDIDEKFNNLGISPLRAFRAPRYQDQDDTDDMLPSSPPDIAHNTRTLPSVNQRHSADNQSLHKPSHATSSLPSRRLHLDDSHQLPSDLRTQSGRLPLFYTLNTLSSKPNSYHVDRAKRRQTLAATPRDSLSMERKIAAQARLQRKGESRKGKHDGKENLRTAVRN